MSKECNGCGTERAFLMVNGASLEEYDEPETNKETKRFDGKKKFNWSMKYKRLCAICFCNRALGIRLTDEQLKTFSHKKVGKNE